MSREARTHEGAGQRPPFEFVGGHPALDFANTVAWTTLGMVNERLRSFADLADWGRTAALLSPAETDALLAQATREPARAAEALARARALRGALHDLFSAVSHGAPPTAACLALLDDTLHESLAHLHLHPAEGAFVWAHDDDESALDAITRRVAWRAAQLLTSEALARVRACAGADCGWLFLDTTKNRSRRWCSMRDCGSRAKARRYYERTTRPAPPER